VIARLLRNRAGMFVLGAVVFLAAGFVYRAVPASDDVIHACYQLPSGQLRVIDAAGGATCRPNEVAITLAQAAAFACPEGTTRFTGACIEDEPRSAAAHHDATLACAGAGGRLPSGGELQGFQAAHGILIGSPAEWTDDVADVNYGANSEWVYFVVTPTGNAISPPLTALPFRCVL
jgi:hypothetical protein